MDLIKQYILALTSLYGQVSVEVVTNVRIATLSVAVVKRPGRILLVASCSPVSSVDMCSATVQCD